MDEPVCPGCRPALKRIAGVEVRVAELPRELDEQMRTGKRHATPLHMGPPKNPDRKSDHAHGTETVEHFPTTTLRHTLVSKFANHCGRCSGCVANSSASHSASARSSTPRLHPAPFPEIQRANTSMKVSLIP